MGNWDVTNHTNNTDAESSNSENPNKCGDTISRQAVIDSLYDWSNHSMTDAETWHLKQIIGDIKSMPSVNPQPCEDTISRQEAENLFRNAREELHKSAIRNEQNGHPIKDLPTRDLMLLNAEQMIHLLPSVTPKQRTGHWITVTNGRGGHECSLCHEYAPSYQNGDECLTKYCPNCGAKMESEDKDSK